MIAGDKPTEFSCAINRLGKYKAVDMVILLHIILTLLCSVHYWRYQAEGRSK